MKQREQALLFIKKASQDEALLAEVISSKAVSDETFGFHCQQAAEKLAIASSCRLGRVTLFSAWLQWRHAAWHSPAAGFRAA